MGSLSIGDVEQYSDRKFDICAASPTRSLTFRGMMIRRYYSVQLECCDIFQFLSSLSSLTSAQYGKEPCVSRGLHIV